MEGKRGEREKEKENKLEKLRKVVRKEGDENKDKK
jgi:hypothetical protein